jgi:hypothetical protein
LEAQYAMQVELEMIPLMMERYKPTGWVSVQLIHMHQSYDAYVSIDMYHINRCHLVNYSLTGAGGSNACCSSE